MRQWLRTWLPAIVAVIREDWTYLIPAWAGVGGELYFAAHMVWASVTSMQTIFNPPFVSPWSLVGLGNIVIGITGYLLVHLSQIEWRRLDNNRSITER